MIPPRYVVLVDDVGYPVLLGPGLPGRRTFDSHEEAIAFMAAARTLPRWWVIDLRTGMMWVRDSRTSPSETPNGPEPDYDAWRKSLTR